MADCITDNGVADVFVESMAMQLEALGENGRSDGEANTLRNKKGKRASINLDDGSSDEVQFTRERKSTDIQDVHIKIEEPIQRLQECSHNSREIEATDSSSDSEYLPRGFCSSDEDKKAVEIDKNFKEFKKKLKSTDLKSLDDATYASNHGCGLDGCNLLDGNSTPYADSSDEDESFEEGTSDQVIRKEDKFPKFDRKSETPTFALGMKFNGKKEFKDAIIKYGLAERKVIKFIKDEGDRVRAKCDWPMCPWVCLLRKTSLARVGQ